jgi:hypothetical protein
MFQKMVKTQFEKKVKVLRSDNGTKYTNRAMQDFLRDNSIVHQTTCVSTSEQNGVAEKKNRHILEVTRCLLFAMNVPKYLWGETSQTATYLINRMSLRTVDFSTPFEMLTCTASFKVPLKKFGCVCFVHNTSLGISKLDVKSHKCVFVGYSSGKKGYKFYDPVKKRMFESLDVIFRETQQYFVLSNAQSNTSPVTFQDTLEVVVTLPSGRIGREGENVVVASEDGIEDIMDLSDIMDMSPSTSSNSRLNSSMDQNLPSPTRQIHKVYTRKHHHKNVEQLFVQDQHQLLVPVDDSSTTQTPGNLELPSGTHFPSGLDLPIAVRKGVRSTVLEQKEGASISYPISHYISFETLSYEYKAFATSLHSNFVPCD